MKLEIKRFRVRLDGHTSLGQPIERTEIVEAPTFEIAEQMIRSRYFLSVATKVTGRKASSKFIDVS